MRSGRRVSATRRHRYRRRHTPHYYLVVSGLTGAALTCVLNVLGYVERSIVLAEVAFAAVSLTALVIFTAFFWGFYMVMSGHIPVHRLKVLIPHAAVGVISPLLYTLNICVALDGLGTAPLTGLSVGTSIACFALLCVQFAMGKGVVRTEPLHLVPPVPPA